MTQGHDHSCLSDGASPRLRALHIVTLCAFAFSQPVLQILINQSLFLYRQGLGWPEYSALLMALTFVVPACWVVLDFIVVRCLSRFCSRGRNAVLFILGALTLLSVLRVSPKFESFELNHLTWLFSATVATCGAGLFAYAYDRISGLRFWLTVSSIGIAVFPLFFIWQVLQSQYGNPGNLSSGAVGHPIPVVIVVFDEFSGTSLMDDCLQMNTHQYPNFSQLASLSTWYRKATTVHARTDEALPAILSGQFPASPRRPFAANYPGNLFQAIHASQSYDMSVFEPYTRLAPAKLKHHRLYLNLTRFQRIVQLLEILGGIYPHLIFPNDTPISFPSIHGSWFGLPLTEDESMPRRTSGVFSYSPLHDRDRQLEHFLDCLCPTEKPLFAFLHVLLPHVPWEYFPSGNSYREYRNLPEFTLPEGLGELGETWPSDDAFVLRCEHRYLMQVKFSDRFVGRLLDKLRQTQLLDDCLLIVTADHGVSFHAGSSRRVPDAKNIADILSIPLFIKLPGQTEGRIDDRNIESVDLYPTIAEELQMQLTEPFDGSPVSKEARRPRKTLYFEGKMTAIEPTFPQLKSAVERQWNFFGGHSLESPPPTASSRPEWKGRHLDEFVTQNIGSSVAQTVEFTSPILTGHGDTVTTSLISGCVMNPVNRNTPPEIVVSIDGRIQDSSRTVVNNAGNHAFSLVIPESADSVTPMKIEFFLIEQGDSETPRLLRLRTWYRETSR